MPPVARYIYDAEHTIEVVEGMLGQETASALAYEFHCGNKVGMSRRAARRVKREHIRYQKYHRDHRCTGVASIYECIHCGKWHVHSVMQRMDLIERLKNKIMAPKKDKVVPYISGVIDVKAFFRP